MNRLLIPVCMFFAAVNLPAQDCCRPSKASGIALQDKGSRNLAKDDVSIYEVPLVCSAAPEIGCGSKSKPVLLGLEESPAVQEAWLNRAGTLLAVVWDNKTSRETRSEAIEFIARKNNIRLTALQGEDYNAAVKGFPAKESWYRGSEVDRLSETEAHIIAERMIHRIKARVALSDEKAEILLKAVEENCKRQFIGDPSGTRRSTLRQLEDELLRAAREHLTERELEAFRESLALGYRPLPNEK